MPRCSRCWGAFEGTTLGNLRRNSEGFVNLSSALCMKKLVDERQRGSCLFASGLQPRRTCSQPTSLFGKSASLLLATSWIMEFSRWIWFASSCFCIYFCIANRYFVFSGPKFWSEVRKVEFLKLPRVLALNLLSCLFSTVVLHSCRIGHYFSKIQRTIAQISGETWKSFRPKIFWAFRRLDST